MVSAPSPPLHHFCDLENGSLSHEARKVWQHHTVAGAVTATWVKCVTVHRTVDSAVMVMSVKKIVTQYTTQQVALSQSRVEKSVTQCTTQCADGAGASTGPVPFSSGSWWWVSSPYFQDDWRVMRVAGEDLLGVKRDWDWGMGDNAILFTGGLPVEPGVGEVGDFCHIRHAQL